MSDPSAQRVSCPTCHRAYRWQAEHTGKQVACKQCDTLFIVPDQPGVAQAVEPVGYEIGQVEEDQPTIERDKCPSCKSPLRVGAVLCMNCGFSLEEGGKIQTAVAEPLGPEDPGEQEAELTKKQKREQERAIDTIAQHQWQDYKLPALIAGIGLLFALINVVLVPSSDLYSMGLSGAGEQRLGFTLWISINTVISMILLFGALLANVAIFGAAFGSFGSVLLKILAITLVCRQSDALFVISMDLLFDLGIVGVVLSWGIYLGLYIALCMKLLDLDAVEMRLVIGFVVVARVVGAFLINVLVASLF